MLLLLPRLSLPLPPPPTKAAAAPRVRADIIISVARFAPLSPALSLCECPLELKTATALASPIKRSKKRRGELQLGENGSFFFH